ncbi:MAG TPA: flagellin [Rhodocyclaceae bacterium]|nr:flagellin [Rhodocyclaceae bacterium]HRQ45338.1 flagellin [Rhodocyclaceae bacterium]
MSSVINTNTYSLNAQRSLAKNSLGLASAMERLSSGLRVNSSKDDAAGLAIGMTMDKQARSLASNIRNSSDQISKAQIADGALAVVGDIALRIEELLAQRANGTLTATEQGYIDSEITSLVSAAATIQSDATINGQPAITTTVTITSAGGQISAIAASRAAEGATMNTEEFKIQSFRANYENQMAAKSRIMDADYAMETANLARFQILQQAGTAMVAQANAIPQNVLALLR